MPSNVIIVIKFLDAQDSLVYQQNYTSQCKFLTPYMNFGKNKLPIKLTVVRRPFRVFILLFYLPNLHLHIRIDPAQILHEKIIA